MNIYTLYMCIYIPDGNNVQEIYRRSKKRVHSLCIHAYNNIVYGRKKDWRRKELARFGRYANRWNSKERKQEKQKDTLCEINVQRLVFALYILFYFIFYSLKYSIYVSFSMCTLGTLIYQ